MPSLVGASAMSLFWAVLLVPLAMRMAVRLRIVDRPCARKLHVRVTPLLGGLAVYSAALIYQTVSGAMSGKIVALMVACGAAVALGIVDDRYDIQSRFRLFAHFLLAFLLIAAGFRTEILPVWLDVIVAALWITGMVNAMNCLDCADGIVGGTAGIILGTYGALLVMTGNVPLAILCFAFAGASLGFLLYNFPPARIFLGDCGSTALGLLIGAVSLRAAAHVGEVSGPAVAWLAFLPALMPAGDILLVHVRRYLGGTRSIRDLLASTGKDHLPHRLLLLGLSPAGTALTVYAITACLCAAAITGLIWPAGSVAAVVVCAGVVLRVERSYCALMSKDRGPARLSPGLPGTAMVED